ncbi:MAG: hypothetical protein JJT75_02390 [Opitutales bacterium]|nr:hypothetical protein [Opitutales bacterium]MCH8539771.1 hypothetical protein [Opitutales bacterium]
MINLSVYTIVASQGHAEAIVSSLKANNFPNNRISVLFPEKAKTKDLVHERITKTPEGAVTGRLADGVLGGALGWIDGIGALTIPGVGPFIAAGPLAAAMGGDTTDPSAGGIAGGLIDIGIPEIEAKRYERKIKNGMILVFIHAQCDEEITMAKEILDTHQEEATDPKNTHQNNEDKPRTEEAASDRNGQTPYYKSPAQNRPPVLVAGEGSPHPKNSTTPLR